MAERVVIVGSSVAAIRTARELRQLGHEGEIVVLGEENEMPYDKPPLSKQLLLGLSTEDDVSLLGPGGWDELQIDGRLGQRAVGVDLDEKVVHVAGGPDVDYDVLVIATGVRPRWVAGVVSESARVLPIRELKHVRALSSLIDGVEGQPRLLVVGGGFIGAEVASSAADRGARVTVVEVQDQLFGTVLGPELGARLTSLHRDRGVEVLTGVGVSSVDDRGDHVHVVLDDGSELAADVVVVGLGTTPNTEWLEGSGVALGDGVIVDQGCAVLATEDVYAVGDVASMLDPRTGQHRRVEHWTSAVEQARVVAEQIIDPATKTRPPHAPYFWSDQHSVKIQMVGRPAPQDDFELRSFMSGGRERLVGLYTRHGVLTAAVTLAWPRAIGVCRAAVESGGSLADVLAPLNDLSDASVPA